MKTLRFGIIGASGRGELADWAHQPENGSVIACVAERYPEQKKMFIDRYKKKFNIEVPVYDDYREMIDKENLDGVFVTAPDFLHEEMAVYALEHKVPVYLEKPIAISIEGADHILEAAYRNRTKLVIGHNMRYMAFTRKMREIIQQGTIGEVKAIWCRHFVNYGGDAYFRDWHAERRYSNSLLLQKGAHDIDIIHWFADSFTAQVSGIGNLSVYDKLPRRAMNDKHLPEGLSKIWAQHGYPPETQKDFYPIIEVEDLNMITMKLKNGVLASYQQCHYTPDTCRNYTIIGTKGRIENFGDYQPSSEIQVWTTRREENRMTCGDITYRVDTSVGTHGGADPLIIQSFVDAVAGTKYDVWSTPQAARYSVACGCKGAESIRTGGGLLDVPSLPDYLENWNFAEARENK